MLAHGLDSSKRVMRSRGICEEKSRDTLKSKVTSCLTESRKVKKILRSAYGHMHDLKSEQAERRGWHQSSLAAGPMTRAPDR